MRLERLLVVPAFVAKKLAERFESPRIAHQPVPEVMAGLVAQMTKQSAIGLTHRQAKFLALSVIGFGEINGDEAVLIACHYPMSARIRGIGQEVEDEPILGIFGATGERKVKPY